MKKKILAFGLLSVSLFVMVGCSSEPAQATAEQKKNFAGGPPPANYMDKANATTAAAQAKVGDKPKTP